MCTKVIQPIMLMTCAIADPWLIYFLRKQAVPFENCLSNLRIMPCILRITPYFLRIEKEQGCILPGFIPENQENNEVFLKAKKEPVLIFLHIKN